MLFCVLALVYPQSLVLSGSNRSKTVHYLHLFCEDVKSNDLFYSKTLEYLRGSDFLSRYSTSTRKKAYLGERKRFP